MSKITPGARHLTVGGFNFRPQIECNNFETGGNILSACLAIAQISNVI